MSQSEIVKLVAKPLWTGTLGFAGTYFWYGENGPMIIMNKLVPGWFAIGRAIAVASYLAEVLDEFVLAKIPDNPYAKYEGMLIAPVATGAGAYIALRSASSLPIPWTEPFILGAGAQLVSNATFDNWVAPAIQNI